MKFTKIALAAAVTLVAAQAQAATVYLAGASATAANYRTALTSLCSGTATTYTNTSDSNKFAVKCSVNFTGIPGVDAVSFNVSGGSFTAITTSAGNATDVFVDVAAANPNTALTAARKSEGGFLDIDAAAFPAAELANAGLSAAPATEAATFSQVFGVVVSNDLYTALQTQQGLTGCGVDSVSAACQPNITKAQYTTIVSDAFNSAKTLGAEFLIGAAGANQKLTLCRRVSTSGTQASSNQFFLNSYIGSDGSVGGSLQPATAVGYDGSADSGTELFKVEEGAGTGNTRTCLSNAGYAIGVVSAENVFDLTTRSGGARADRKWRYVKLNGVNAFDGVANGNTANAKAGQYEFWFTSQKYGHTTNGKNVVNAIDAALGSVNALGLFDNASSAAKRDSNVSPIRFD